MFILFLIVRQDLESGEDVFIIKNKEGKKEEVLSKKSCPIVDIVKRVGRSSNEKERSEDLSIFNLLIENNVDLTLKSCIVTSQKSGNLNVSISIVTTIVNNRYVIQMCWNFNLSEILQSMNADQTFLWKRLNAV